MPCVLLVHHFFYPDDVVSARLYTDLALGLQERGWEVTVLTSDRSWADPRRLYPAREVYRGVHIERLHRPAWRQSFPAERLANSGWLSARWMLHASSMPRFDAIVVGSDPAFSLLQAPWFRQVWPRAAIVHWCHDLYPEAVAAMVADTASPPVRGLVYLARRLMAFAYRECDAVVDVGPVMRSRLTKYPSGAARATIPPWALFEPDGSPRAPEPSARAALFGDAQLGLLYAGALGRNHDLGSLLELARACRRRFEGRVAFCFACWGERVGELRSSLTATDRNIQWLASPATEDRLGPRLEAADVHLVSLRREWSGISVPSKFFGALATGRPVVYAGDPESDVATWIDELGIGCTFQSSNMLSAIEVLGRLAESPSLRATLGERAAGAYRTRFSRDRALDAWHRMLRSAVEARSTRRR